MDVRKKIDNLRIKKGWSLSKLAREICISETSVYNWYNDYQAMPVVETLENICDLFGITMSELFFDGETDRLTEKQTALLSLFAKLSEDKKDTFIEMLRAFVGGSIDSKEN